MNLDKVFVIDIETKGLLEEIEGVETDLHVLGVSFLNSENKWQIKTTNKKEDIKKILENPNNTVVGHNLFMFDTPALEKIYKDIDIKATIIDTLLLAWYIEPNRIKEGGKYGLADYGEMFGIKKPEIESTEWVGLEQDKIEIIKYFERFNK